MTYPPPGPPSGPYQPGQPGQPSYGGAPYGGAPDPGYGAPGQPPAEPDFQPGQEYTVDTGAGQGWQQPGQEYAMPGGDWSGQPSGPPMGPPGYGPPPGPGFGPPPPPPPSKGGVKPGVIIGIVIGVVVVLGLGIGAVVFAVNEMGSSGGHVRAGASGGPSSSHSAAPAVKYKKAPADMCPLVDVTPMVKLLGAQAGSPTKKRQAGDTTTTVSCTFKLGNEASTDPNATDGDLEVTLTWYSDPNDATESYNSALQSKQQNSGGEKTIPGGVGDRSYFNILDTTPSYADTFTLAVLDGNVEIEIESLASHMSGHWSDADFTNVQNAFATIAKATLPKVATAQ